MGISPKLKSGIIVRNTIYEQKADDLSPEENEADIKRARENLIKTIKEIRKNENIKATGRPMDENDPHKKESRESLTKDREDNQKEESVKAKTEGKKIEGFEMVEEKAEDTKVTSSGSSWVVMVIVVGILGLLLVGWRRKKV